MDARERWQALQSRLTAARTAFDAGDRDGALVEVDAALGIDPSFLAAAALRERILNSVAPSNARVPGPAGAPLVSTEGYARFEQRALRRRVDRRLIAAKQAIAKRNLRAAAAALDEVIDLDPNLPDLSELTAAFDALRRARTRSRRGPVVAAAAAFITVMFGATWLGQDRVLHSIPSSSIASLVDAPTPDPLALSDDPITEPSPEAADAPAPSEPVAVATAGHPQIVPASVTERRAVSSPTTPVPAPVFVPAPAPQPASPIASPPVSIAPAASLPSAAAAIDVPKPSLPPPRPESDDTQISRLLQQYRLAYGELDAARARAVWPAVNEAALARAFDALASQTLTFDACRTQLSGDAAVATCQGSARYVPKIGSREPRVEPRTWTFILRRSSDGWMIDTARAER